MDHRDVRWIEDAGRDAVRVLAPAKINLFLAIRHRRTDGYHELKTLMCPVGLFDTLHMSLASANIQVHCQHPQVPDGESNIAWKAARTFLDHADADCGVNITIEKRIPVAAGLGGGSSDAAAVLTGLNHLFSQPLENSELEKMGATLGADVPFFIERRPAIAAGIGEILESAPRIPDYDIVLIAFNHGVSTTKVYKKLNLALTKCLKIHSKYPLEESGFLIERHLCNDLEQVTTAGFPGISEAKKALLNHGAKGAMMSGSGPTVFGLFTDSGQAKEAASALSRHADWMVHSVEMIH